MPQPFLIDLSSNVIPVDEEEDEEETYDDVEGLVNSTPPRLPKASHVRGGGGGQETMEADEDGDDIYEELPGKRMLWWKQPPDWSLTVN